MMEATSVSDSTNLIQLIDNTNTDVSEFDPLASTIAPQSVPRRPSRPPPPPPVQVSKNYNRSDNVNEVTLSNNLVNLDFSQEPNTDTSVDNAGMYDPSRPMGKASFISYVSDNLMDENSSNISNSLPSLQQLDGATGHNQIASKLLGHREELMQLFMAKRQDDYTSRRPLRIFAGTWNVNGQYPPDAVNEWTACDDIAPDIYVTGFQELDLSKEALLFGESTRQDEWLRVVTKSLHSKEQYELVKHIRLVGMMLLVFAKKCHIPFITNVVAHQVGTGLLGKMGNKGGVGIRFNLYSSTLCVVNSHLAAHAELTQKRNEDYSDICQRMKFPDPDGLSQYTIFQHDVLLWLGDLNYRIDRMLPETVKQLIDEGHYKLLKENDQLLCQRKEGHVFQYFDEGEINFRPTYKYNPGTDIWDTSEKCRTPAWCDRVLWRDTTFHHPLNKTKPRKSMHLRKYRSHQSPKISDHKPVSAVFDMDVKVIDKMRYRKVYEEEIRRLDRMENDWLPTMTLSQQNIEFGDIKFQQPSTRHVELHNTGQTPCHYEFIGKLGNKTICKPWLTITKPSGFVMPDEKLEVEFEVYVNKFTAVDLNTGVDKIEDILILHLVGGKDFFISLNGQFCPSCFGTSIEALCRMKKPISQIPREEIALLSKISATSQNIDKIAKLPKLQVPKELWRLLDHLYHNARHQDGLFQQPGLHNELQDIQESLDLQLPSTDGSSQLPGSNHSVAEALLVFLEALPEPVIPFAYYSSCLDVCADIERAKELIATMSACHRSVFNYLIAFLQELPKYETDNGLSFHDLATTFSGLLLRPLDKKSGIEGRLERTKATDFIKSFLLTRLDDF